MPPGATTRGLSLCYAFLVNAAAGTMRRPLVLATTTASGSTAPCTANPPERTYHRCRRPKADVKAIHAPTETVLHHDDDRAAGSIRRRYRATTLVTTGFTINTARAASTGSRSRIRGMGSHSGDDMILQRLVRQARSTAGGRTTPRPRVPSARNAWVPMMSASSAGIDAVAPSSGEFCARAMSTAAEGNVGGDSGEKIMKVTLLSGFLGAGKTTLMRNVLRQAREQHLSLAVIVNDMADVNIDARMLAAVEKDGAGLGADLRSVGDRGDGDGDGPVVAMQDGCICCALRDELILEVEALARQGRHDHLIIESTGISDPTPVAEAFAAAAADPDDTASATGGGRDSGSFSLDTLVTVLDSTSFLDEVRKADDLEDRGLEAQEGDTRTIADLLVAQVEFANVILLNKADLVAKAEDMATLEAVVRRLNPAARVLRTVSSSVGLTEVLGTGQFDLEEASQAAEWLQALNEKSQAHNHDDRDHGQVSTHERHDRQHHYHGQDHGHEHVHGRDCAVDYTNGSSGRRNGETFGIGSFTFRSNRPFHPERLMGFVMEHLPSVLRSKGFLWLATRHDVAGVWNQAGGSFATEYGGAWDSGEADDDDVESDDTLSADGDHRQRRSDRSSGDAYASDSAAVGDTISDDGGSPRNELVFIGLLADMKEEVLRAELQLCLLTDGEMTGGPEAWKGIMTDPFPSWLPEAEGEEEGRGIVVVEEDN